MACYSLLPPVTLHAGVTSQRRLAEGRAIAGAPREAPKGVAGTAEIALRPGSMFSLLVLAALAVVAVVTSFISGIFGMAGRLLRIGFLLVPLPVPVALGFPRVIPSPATGFDSSLVRRYLRLSRGLST